MKGKIDQKRNRILIIDDQPLFREGFKTIVNRSPRFKVVGETGSGSEGFRMVKSLRPDLVVMEMFLHDQETVQLIRDIRNFFSEIFVMILSAYHETEYISQALQAGATGYVVKEIDSATLLKGFVAVLRGDYFMGRSVSSNSVVAQLETCRENKKNMETPIGHLTPRECEIMRLMAEGVTRREIAERLFISPKTVENHAWRIMKKLSINSIVELVRYAVKFGVIDVDLWKGTSVPDQLLAQHA